MIAHTLAPDTGRNVRCTCGAEYSQVGNLMAHIRRAEESAANTPIADGGEGEISKRAAVGWRKPVSARTVSDLTAVADIARTLDVLGTLYRQEDTVNGFYARTGLGEGADTRGGLCYDMSCGSLRVHSQHGLSEEAEEISQHALSDILDRESSEITFR